MLVAWHTGGTSETILNEAVRRTGKGVPRKQTELKAWVLVLQAGCVWVCIWGGWGRRPKPMQASEGGAPQDTSLGACLLWKAHSLNINGLLDQQP